MQSVGPLTYQTEGHHCRLIEHFQYIFAAFSLRDATIEIEISALHLC